MSGPWEDFAPAPQSGGPWEDFADQPSVAADVAKSGAAGLAKGAIGVATSPYDLPKLAEYGVSYGLAKAAEKLGMLPEGKTAEDFVNDAQKTFGGPGFAAPQVQGAIEKVTGPFHEAQTTPGRYADTIGQFIPGAMVGPMLSGEAMAPNIARSAVVPAIGAETAGEVTQGTPLEPWARMGGALVAPLATRAVTPLPIDATRQGLVNTLRQEGVPLTAGQVTGSKPLKFMESALSEIPFSGGRAEEIQDAQRRAFTAAALRRAGIASDEASPGVMAQGYGDLGQRFEDLSQNNTLRVDQPLVRSVLDAETEYHNLTNPGARAPQISNLADQILNASSGAGTIPGETYQNLRSQLSKQAETFRMTDPARADALRTIRDSLDAAMERSLSPEDQGAWAQARQDYGNYKTLERAAGGAGENAAQGQISPAQLKNAASVGNRRGSYVRGESELGNLARAGVGVMSPLPNSGTPGRHFAQALLAAPGAAVGAMTAGAPGAAVGALAGPASAALMGRALMSRPVQGYLSNQLLGRLPPDNIARSLYAATLARQLASPSQ